jgi:hypothetical protein
MALLSGMMRTVAITGRTDTVNAWFADRQGGRWAEQTVRGAFPTLPGSGHPAARPGPVRPAGDPAKTREELEALHRGGVLTAAELERLRGRLGV